MALPEGYQPLFLEDALYSLQDAMILSPWVSGGELLDLKLEENRFKCPIQEFTTLTANQC